MKKKNTKLALLMAVLMICSTVLVMVPASIQTAKADAPTQPSIAGGTNTKPVDGPIVGVAQLNTSSYYLTADGTVLAYGSNGNGEIGAGLSTTSNATTVVPVIKASDNSPLTGIDRIWGNHNSAIFAYDYDTNVLYGWGLNQGYRVDPAQAITAKISKAYQIVALPAGFKLSKSENAIAVGAKTIALLDENNNIWTWGNMHDTTTGATDLNQLGYDYVTDGTLDTDHSGEYGVDGTVTSMKVAHQITALSSYLNAGEKVTDIYMGFGGTYFAFTNQHNTYTWGGSAANLSINTLYGAPFVKLDVPAGVTIQKIQVGKSGNVIALGDNGRVYVLNGYQFVGNITTNQRPVVPMTRSKALEEPNYLLPTPTPRPPVTPTPEPPTPTPEPTPTPAGPFNLSSLESTNNYAIVGQTFTVTMDMTTKNDPSVANGLLGLGVFSVDINYDPTKLSLTSYHENIPPVQAGEVQAFTPGTGSLNCLWLSNDGGLTGIGYTGATNHVMTLTFTVLDSTGPTSITGAFSACADSNMVEVPTYVKPLNFEVLTTPPTPVVTLEPGATEPPLDLSPHYKNALEDAYTGGYTFTDIGSGADAASKWFTQSYMAVRSDGKVFVWGNETNGRLGDGQRTQDYMRTVAMPVDQIPGFPSSAVAMGGDMQLSLNGGAMIKNGVIYQWGQNDSDQYGAGWGRTYPQLIDAFNPPDGLAASSNWPVMVNYSAFPAAYRYTPGTGYPSDTPVADVAYTLNAVPALNGGNLTVTATGLNANLEGKTINFYVDSATKHFTGTAVVSGGTATGVIAGVYGGDYTVTAQSADATNLLWAPALHGFNITIVKEWPPEGQIDFYPEKTSVAEAQVGQDLVVTAKSQCDARDVAVFNINVEYDASKLTYKSIAPLGGITADELTVVDNQQTGVLTVLYLDEDGLSPILKSASMTDLFALTFTATAQGNATVKIVPDVAGAPNMQPLPFVNGHSTTFTIYPVDVIAPVVSGVVEGGIYNEDRTITWTDVNPTTATLNGEVVTSGVVVSANGDYTLVVTDGVNPTTVHFTIDKDAPVISGFNDNQWYNAPVTVTYDEGTGTVFGDPIASGSVVAAEGFYTIRVVDPAGNVSEKSFGIDTVAPVVTGVANGGVYNVDKQITFNEGTATLNGAAFLNGNTVVAEGVYTLVVTDKAGNPTTVRFTVDKTAPLVVGVENGKFYNSSRVIVFNEGKATLNGVPMQKNGTVLNADGDYTVVVTDAAGNSTTVSFVIDKVAPVVTGALDGKTYNTARTMSYTDAHGCTATLNGDVIANGAVVDDAGDYVYTVTDAAGNSTTVAFKIEDVTMIWAKHTNDSITGFNAAGTSVEEVMAGITVADTTTMIITQNGETMVGATSIVTGMQVELRDDNDVLFATYPIAIIGDLDGNGKINAIDLLKLKKITLGTVTVDGAFFTAADINKDDQTTPVMFALDLLALKKHVLSQIIIAQ